MYKTCHKQHKNYFFYAKAVEMKEYDTTHPDTIDEPENDVSVQVRLMLLLSRCSTINSFLCILCKCKKYKSLYHTQHHNNRKYKLYRNYIVGCE